MLTANRSDLAAILAAALAGLILFGTGWLLQPDPQPGDWSIEWAGARDGMDRFSGRILIAAAGTSVMRPGPAATTGNATAVLRRGGLLVIGAIAGEPTSRPAPLVTLYASDASEALTVAVQGHDVLFRQRTRASRFNLQTPFVRAPGSLATVAAGDTLRVMTMNHPQGRCIQVQDRPFCGLGFTPGYGWQLIAGERDSSSRTATALNAAWLALLLLPAGLMARPRVAAVILVAAVWYLVIRLPVDTLLQAAPASEAAAAAGGVLLGTLLRWRSRRSRPVPNHQPVVAEA